MLGSACMMMMMMMKKIEKREREKKKKMRPSCVSLHKRDETRERTHSQSA